MKRKMTDSEENFDSALEEALQCLSQLGMSRGLRTEQTKAIHTLVSGGDLLAVLPTGFGKSLISLPDKHLEDIENAKYQFVFASAEKVRFFPR